MFLTLVRHGQSEGNLRRVITGWGSGPLTPLGREEAALTAQRLVGWGAFDVLYSSPLERTRETATIIGDKLGLRPLFNDDLRELNVGLVEGRRGAELEGPFPGLLERFRRLDPTLFFPQGESIGGFLQRAKSVFQQISALHPQGHVLAVSHVNLLSAYLTQLFEERASMHLVRDLWNCSLTKLELVDGRVMVHCFNDHSHLDCLWPEGKPALGSPAPPRT